jgi:Tol biopolymer transport system component
MRNSYLQQLARRVLGRGRGGRRPAPARRRSAVTLTLEQLEGRCLLSTLQAISLPSAANPPSDTAAGASTTPSVSADGRIVAFTSTANNLVPNESAPSPGAGAGAGPDQNIYLLDRSTGVTALVSHAAGSASQAGNGECDDPILSADGSTVVYDSLATDLAGRTIAPVSNVYLYNRLTGTNTLVSHRAADPLSSADGSARVQAVSGDGRFVVFFSAASDLVAGQAGAPGNLFLFDASSGAVTLMTHTAASLTTGAGADTGDLDGLVNGSPSAISDDGSLFAYVSTATALLAGPVASGPNVYLFHRATDTNTLVTASAGTGAGKAVSPAALSHDGHFVVYSAGDVFRYDTRLGTTLLVSHVPGSLTTGGNGASGVQNSALPIIRGAIPDSRSLLATNVDGSVVAFVSSATNLLGAPTNYTGNLFVWDASGTVSPVTGPAGGGGTVSGPFMSTAIFSSNTYLYGDLSLSDDGTEVAYASASGDVVAGQTGPAGLDNVFLDDREANTVRLVSGAGGSGTATGNAASNVPVLSRDGTALEFQTQAFNLSGTFYDANGNFDVLVYSVAPSPGLTLVSRRAFLVQTTGYSFLASTSADGRYTVFTSNGTNLVPNQVNTNSDQNVFLHDGQTGSTVLVDHLPNAVNSTGDGGIGTADPTQAPAPELRPVISADGRYVAFVSDATNLVTGVPSSDQSPKVFLYEVATGKVTQVSDNQPVGPHHVDEGRADSPAISGDGHYVAYDNVSGGDLLDRFAILYDTVAATGVTIFPSDQAGGDTFPTISDDGRFVAFSALHEASSSGFYTQAYLFDRTTGTAIPVSHTSGSATALANGTSGSAVVSHDGSAVAFVSAAPDLVAGQATGSFTNVFLYAVSTGTVRLVSGVNGSPTSGGHGNSDSPAIGLGGGYVAYRSDATNLVRGQTGPAGNVFEFNAAAGSQTLVSHQAGSPTTAAGGSSEPVLDDDGHLIAYASTAGNLIPGQGGPVGVKNIFIWLRQTDANILASGQDGSPTVGGDADSDQPVLTRHSFPGFSSKARLLPATGGASVAYINTLVALALSSNVIADGSGPGSLVGYLSVSSLLAGQYLPPTYRVPGAGGALFAVGAAAGSSSPLLTQFLASHAAQASYQVTLLVDVGFGFDPVTFEILVSPPPSGGGGVGGPRPITARLVPVRAGRKKRRLMVEVFYADTGALKEEFLSPFQKGPFKDIHVTVRDGSDGIADEVVISARKGRKKVTAAHAG